MRDISTIIGTSELYDGSPRTPMNSSSNDSDNWSFCNQVFPNFRKGLKIACHNINRLINKNDTIKLDQLKLLLECDCSPPLDVYCVCETFLTESVDDAFVSINGFQTVRNDRTHKGGGGLIVYVRNGIKFKRRHDLETKAIETIWLELQFSNRSVLLSAVYRPPNNDSNSVQNWLSHMEDSLSVAYSENKPLMLTGDFNIDLSKPDTSALHVQWESVYKNVDLRQIIEEPTRVTKTSSTLIDHMYVSDLQITHSSVVKFGISDHFPVLCVIDVKNDDSLGKQSGTGRHKTISYRKFENVNLDSFKHDLQTAAWNEIDIQNHSADECLRAFNHIFKPIVDKHLPVVTKRVKRQTQPKWMTSDILKAINLRDTAKRQGKEDVYKYWRNQTTKLISDAKANHYTKSVELHKTNPRMLSNIFQDLGGKSTKHMPTSINYCGKAFENDTGIAQALNEHFTSIADKYLKNVDSNAEHDHMLLKQFVQSKLPPGNVFQIPPTNEEWIRKYLTSLNTNKATGLDDISAKVLKLAAPYVSKWIAKICNHSIRTSQFPEVWKKARVTPLHKKNSVHEVENYRPISILPVLSKILEKHVSIALYEFLTVNDLFSQRQSGFRNNHSCETALNLMTDEWLNSIHNGEYTGILFVDMCKAFDLVNHELLLQKLEIYNSNQSSLLWFKSYLSNRTQCVQVNKSVSAQLPINYGVPQGSILGPLLFLIFINDLPLYSTSGQINIFADDSTTTVKSSRLDTVNTLLQEETNNVVKWCTENKMVLNTEKTKVMLLATKQKLRNAPPALQVEVQNTLIETVSEDKVLGVIIDNNLSWKSQVQKVRKTVLFKLSILRRIRKYLPKHTRILFYNYYVKPHLDYCCSVWGNCSKRDCNIIIKLQKQAARLVLDADRLTPSKEMFNSLNWLTFTQIVHQKQATLVYKSLNNLAPSYMAKMFHLKRNDGLRSTTHNKLFIPRAHPKSFRYCGAKLWNSLPDNVRCAQNIRQFKTNYSRSNEH